MHSTIIWQDDFKLNLTQKKQIYMDLWAQKLAYLCHISLMFVCYHGVLFLARGEIIFNNQFSILNEFSITKFPNTLMSLRGSIEPWQSSD